MKIICLSKCQVNNGKPSSMLITLYPYTSSYILEQNVIRQESKNWPKLQARTCVEGSRQLYFAVRAPRAAYLSNYGKHVLESSYNFLWTHN